MKFRKSTTIRNLLDYIAGVGPRDGSGPQQHSIPCRSRSSHVWLLMYQAYRYPS